MTRAGPTRRQLAGLVLLALAAHALLVWWVRSAMADITFNNLPPPVYARVLAPTAAAPPPAVVAAPRPTPRAAPQPAAPTATSSPQDSTPQATPTQVASAASEPPPAATTPVPAEPPSAATAPVATPNAPAATASSAPGVSSIWPASTLVQYDVQGDFRGNINSGSSQLDWRRDGDQYTSEMRTSVGIVRATWRSRGRLVGTTIEPERYEEQATGRSTVAVTIDRAAKKVSFSAITDVLDKPEGVQDTATIFMQMVAQLSAEPGAFAPGRIFSYTVARPRGLRRWDFEVVGRDTVNTALGEFNAWYLKRKPRADEPRDIAFELWLAPQLQNLPVKVRMTLGAEDFSIVMNITKAQQAQ